MLVGLAGLAIACGVGAYKYKNRGAMSTSVFLMQLRVAAQGTVVSCLTLGLTYSMLNEYVFNKPDQKD
jgi:Hypoxia induced protein conserved region